MVSCWRRSLSHLRWSVRKHFLTILFLRTASLDALRLFELNGVRPSLFLSRHDPPDDQELLQVWSWQ